MLLARFLKRLVRSGRLTVIDANGRTHTFGPEDGQPAATIRVHDRSLHTKLALNPRLYLGEAYMNGTVTIEEGSLRDYLEIAIMNVAKLELNRFERMARWVERLLMLAQRNTIGRARRHAARHYDLSAALYDLFLDSDRQYSCAYFESPSSTLEQAQAAKKRHLAAKLLLEPGCKLLDIGSGWGGLGLYLAQVGGADVTGVTLSEEQQKISQARAREAGLDDRVRFHLRDYRDQDGRFDRIVSVGMFEHIGVTRFDEFFTKLHDLLTEDGVALLHTIVRSDEAGATSPWIRKYIFPGGYVPALSEVMPAIERAGLIVTDIEILRLHYAETLKAWHRRFSENRDKIAALYDERFCRMWEFYLVASEMVFRYWDQHAFQIQLARRIDAVPLTRDYIHQWEQMHRRPVPRALASD